VIKFDDDWQTLVFVPPQTQPALDGLYTISSSFIELMSVFKSLKTLGSKAKRNVNTGASASDSRRESPGENGVPFWMERIKHQGKAPYHPDPQYRVFRNVKVRCFP
jgi:hypothetical protein